LQVRAALFGGVGLELLQVLAANGLLRLARSRRKLSTWSLDSAILVARLSSEKFV
jgi:hypothetical protein